MGCEGARGSDFTLGPSVPLPKPLWHREEGNPRGIPKGVPGEHETDWRPGLGGWTLWGQEGDEGPLEQLAWKGVEVEGLVERGEERVVAWKWAALLRALLRYEGLCLLWPCGLCGGLDVA